MPLTDKAAKAAAAKTKTYKLSDEKGMYLEITPKGQKYSRWKYRFAGKEKRLAFGVYPEVSLKEARSQRDECRKQLESGVDPSVARQSLKTAHNIATSPISPSSLQAMSLNLLPAPRLLSMEATLPSDSPQLHSPGALELELLMVFFSAL